jgi:hypothetical protein
VLSLKDAVVMTSTTRDMSLPISIITGMPLGVEIAQFNSDALGAGRRGFDSWKFTIFVFSIGSRPTLGPTQSPTQWVPGAHSSGVKRQGREPDHSLPSSAKVKKGGAIPPLHSVSSWDSA